MGENIKKLTKGKSKMICGVCSGIAEYFGWDATWVRIGTVALACCYGVGLVPYIIAAIVMPKPTEE